MGIDCSDKPPQRADKRQDRPPGGFDASDGGVVSRKKDTEELRSTVGEQANALVVRRESHL